MQPSLRAVIVVLAATAAGALGSLLASAWLPTPPVLHDQDFRMLRGEDDAYDVRPGHPLILPFPFADFDMASDIELAADTDLDLVVRHVEPVLRDEGMPLFHARFAAIRSSTRAEGEPVRTREDALFDRFMDGGVKLAPGRVATITLEARGRVVEGNVAGVPIPPFATTDAHGALAFVSPRGHALVHTLTVQRVPRPLRLMPIGLAAIGGAVLGLALAWLRGSTRRALAALLAVPAVAWVGGALVLHQLVPECEPDRASVVLIALAGAPAALALARLRRPFLAALIGAVCAFAMFELATRVEVPRLAPFEDPRLTACFGWGSDSTPFDVLVPRLRARAEVHVPTPSKHRVFFLGGGMLYEGGADREDWVGPLAANAAHRSLGEPVDGVVVPTLYSCAFQQLALFQKVLRRAVRATGRGVRGAAVGGGGVGAVSAARGARRGLHAVERARVGVVGAVECGPPGPRADDRSGRSGDDVARVRRPREGAWHRRAVRLGRGAARRPAGGGRCDRRGARAEAPRPRFRRRAEAGRGCAGEVARAGVPGLR